MAGVQLHEAIELSLSSVADTGRAPRRSKRPGPVRPEETIRFEPDGTADDAVIELVDGGGNAKAIEVIGLTGEVRLEVEE